MIGPGKGTCGGHRVACYGLFILAASLQVRAAVRSGFVAQVESSAIFHHLYSASRGNSDPQTAGVPPLTQVAQVRNLGSEQAARLIPVKLSGVVTAMPGYKNSFFLQDKTAGISVDRTDEVEVRPGDLVELTGTTGPGLFAPVVLASKVRVVGRGQMPPAPRKTLSDLFGGLQDSQWIELRGVVRSAQRSVLFGRRTLLLDLEMDGGRVNIQLQDFASLDAAHLPDSVIRVRGVCASSGNQKRQFVGSVLLVPAQSDLHVEWAAATNPFAGPVRRVGDILKLGQWQHRVKVAGVVTYQIPGEAIYIQDGTDGIRVQNESSEIVAPGTLVEAVGFPAMTEYAPLLEAGSFRTIGHALPLVATPIDAADVITLRDGFHRAAYDQQLIQMKATLIEDHIQGDQHVWILRQDSTVFEAHLRLSAASGSRPPIRSGSILLLTGICTINVGSMLNPISFTMLLRSPADIVVLRTGPWWTPNRALVSLIALAILTLLVLLWVVVLRNRVARQTRLIRESEGRFRYLSEHDGLTGLMNRDAVLKTLSQQLMLASREKKSVTVILVDIDHFKRINDAYGHSAGDAALLRFAEAMSSCMRVYDSLGRYGGEEFLMVLVGIPATEVDDRLQTLHSAISNLAVRQAAVEFQITCSLGAVLLAEGQSSMDEKSVLALADKALYMAKEAGRNRVVLLAGAVMPARFVPLSPRSETPKRKGP